ncbi:hypothetical protein C6Y40_21765 [Alteromonas alba]|jgi:two-component system sensor histidine kinase UhpB|uniref:histidine kinase n=2 Tax=Alteromonas alba TaxID=2079529 RepID=A0A2S9V528_9ALTE|nr:hypothetical protein C6Y40_21765 [Alteromonas alba]HAU93754.1 hypothetical protein [Alteromonas sp.]HCB17641.1 hypothetical protein [Alteromonas sp.]|tara:strand:+ start:505 stop:1815 length:1311 start_codon:yes stop_codon:yes gene_type:complete
MLLVCKLCAVRLSNMNASNKITLTIVLIFTAVFSLLAVAMFYQARADISEEGEAALQLAETLAKADLDSETLTGILQNSRHLTVIEHPEHSDQLPLTGSLEKWLAPPPASTTIQAASGEPITVVANSAAEFDEISATLANVFFIFVMALLLTLFTLRYAVNTRLKPLAELCQGLDSIQSGQFRLSAASTDIAEIHRLIEHYNKLISSLASKETQVAGLRQRLSALQENERRLLARELHDNLGQLITGITVQTYMLEQQKQNPDFIIKACATIQQQCDAVHQGMKDLTNQLYPVFLNKLGLTTSIAQMIQTWQDIHQIEVNWLPDAATLASNLNRDTQIYRITQEIFNNIAKHSHATEVTIGLTTTHDQLTLFVRDNGRGFNLQQSKAAGLGLESMHERASLLGGTLKLDTHAKGTTVTLVAPLQPQDDLHYEYSDR